MRGDSLVARQRQMAQSVFALANHIEQSTGYAFTPVLFANLPPNPQVGYVACISDGQVSGATQWGNVVSGGSNENLLIWYNGTNWTVIGK